MKKRKNIGKRVLVQGNFDVLHPGHIRLLKFARECGNNLTVAVNSDRVMKGINRVTEDHRLELVKSLECVDDAFLTDASPWDLVDRLKPDVVVKGREFEDMVNNELQYLKSYGGQLIFGSGEFETNAENFIKKNENLNRCFHYEEAREYSVRHDITWNRAFSCVECFKDVNALVIGEVIVDEYVQGTAVGLSQEDPTVVLCPNKTDTFLGGAAITAGHVKALGACNVSFMSVLGKDKPGEYATSRINEYGVDAHFYYDDSRPTPLKKRFRAGKKTLLRVNEVRHHKISRELQEEIIADIEPMLDDLQLLIFSDFNYGLLPTSLVERITTLCHERGVKVVADSQSSSQVGDISRYRNMDLITPTEREVRVALNNSDDGLVVLAQKLTERTGTKSLVVTLGEEGILIHQPDADLQSWENDRLPAINRNAVDPAGAGDCFLAASALAVASGASPWLAYYLGSLAAACQVSTLGNTPLSARRLLDVLEESLQ
jgi:rfaE bifunctional protein kinase chain/domain